MGKKRLFDKISQKQIVIILNWLLNKIANFVKRSEKNCAVYQKIEKKIMNINTSSGENITNFVKKIMGTYREFCRPVAQNSCYFWRSVANLDK